MYDTPAHLARQLARHVPLRVSRLLEPAVGKGALLQPLLRRLERHQTQVVCVDTDVDALNQLSSSFRDCKFHGNYVNEDFLTWGVEQEPLSFDCVMMNPPFAGARADCRTVDLTRTTVDMGQPTVPVPVEAGFISVAHRLLSADGRLLAVLPCSVIMSESLQWLRSYLFRTGSIQYVYEFPPRTFRTVDSKVYLMVYKKGPRRRRVQLIRPQSARSQRMVLRLQDEAPRRLDFDFFHGCVRMQELTGRTDLEWTHLGNVARIFRGTVSSAPRPKGVVHSTDFSQGRWRRPLGEPTIHSTRGQVRFGDLLIRRVGRNSHLTLGDARLVAGFLATDCLFIIRPNDDIASVKLLFAIKSLVGLDWLVTLLERGTGARYFSKSSLEQLPVPLAASDVYSDSYLGFLHADDAGCVDRARAAVLRATNCLLSSQAPKAQQRLALATFRDQGHCVVDLACQASGADVSAFDKDGRSTAAVERANGRDKALTALTSR